LPLSKLMLAKSWQPTPPKRPSAAIRTPDSLD
jgi:hypothetical protein